MTAAFLTPMALAAALVAADASKPPLVVREDPELYDVRFTVQLMTFTHHDMSRRQGYHLEDAPIVMPIIAEGAFSRTDAESIKAQLWLGAHEQDITSTMRLDGGQPYDTKLAVIPVAKFIGQSLRWQIAFRVESWSSRVPDEAALINIAWPREWPEQVQDALKPQIFIESDDPAFAELVQRVTRGKIRTVSPYLAVKELVRACLTDVRVSGSEVNRGSMSELQGINVKGAREALSKRLGTPNDLVCVCVATLRAAGIPARPVVGLVGDDRDRWLFTAWAEFYLPDAGWIPFDPIEMRGKAHGRDLPQPWPDFGSMDDLNERVPLAYAFLPHLTVNVPENAAVWGWDPRPGGDPGSDQAITISVNNRGSSKSTTPPGQTPPG